MILARPWMPFDASAEGHRIDDLLFETNVLVGALVVLVIGWLAVVLIRHGKRHEASFD